MRTRTLGRIGSLSGTLALLLSGTLLAGCSTLGNPVDVISGDRETPDEFQVLARKSLRMPGNLQLPEPRPGARSPLEPDPNTAAVIALLGSPTVASSTTGASAGEQALLSAANAQATDPNIEAGLTVAEEEIERNTPYEPPSLFDYFRDTPEDAKDAINPAVESRRLQTTGAAAAPIDPEDRPPVQPQSVDPTADPIDRRPNNRLPSAPTETAF